jgi:hypothetical protein
LALAMLLLIGLGYTLMTKQNATVGARAAVFHTARLENPPPPAAMNAIVKDAVSPGREEWTLRYGDGPMDQPDHGNEDVFRSAIGRLYQNFNQEIHYTAHGTATLGFLPRIMQLGQAESSYALPHGTWTCSQVGGTYSNAALRGMGLPDPLAGWLDFSCCETY